MQINLKTAVNVLKSTEKTLRQEIQDPKKTIDDALLDTVELSPRAKQANGAVTSPGLDSLYGELADHLSSLTSLIGNSANEQGTLSSQFGNANNSSEVQKKAQELLEGYFNVENTSSRIFDFAFSFYEGGDRESFAREMQGHIHEGFRQAEKQLGGLADISLETRDTIDQKIEDFISAGEETEAPSETEPQTEPSEPTGRVGLSEDLLKRANIPSTGFHLNETA